MVLLQVWFGGVGELDRCEQSYSASVGCARACEGVYVMLAKHPQDLVSPDKLNFVPWHRLKT